MPEKNCQKNLHCGVVGISKPGISTSGNGMPLANGGGNLVLVILIRVWKGLWWICTGLWPGLWDDKISGRNRRDNVEKSGKIKKRKF